MEKKTKRFLEIAILGGLAATVWLLLIPGEAENAVFLGYSIKRLVLLIPLLLPSIAALCFRMKMNREDGLLEKVFNKLPPSKIIPWLVPASAVWIVLMWSMILLLPMMLLFINRFMDMGAYFRLLPLMIFYLLLGLEVVFYIPLVLYSKNREKSGKKEKFPLGAFLAALAVILVGLALVEAVGWGKNPERVSIIVMGVPIMEGQLWYVIGLLVLGALAAFSWVSIPAQDRPDLGKRKDVLIAVLIWLAAVALWMSLPLPKHNYFAPLVRAPNYELYPFSDAEQYDFNSIYVYYGALKDFVVSKPLYVTFLTLLHAIGGLDYARIVFLQTLVIAFFPVVLYFIGRELHSRYGGIALALLAIFREMSAIQATNIANVSNTKLLLSDMPATLLVSLLVLIMIRWFKFHKKKVSGYEFLIGGLAGALILTRIQTMVLVPFLIMLIVVRYLPKLKTVLLSTLILLTSVALMLTPVLMRNHSITNVYWVDNPSSSQGLYKFFMDVGDFEIEVPEAETREENLERNISVIKTVFIKGMGDVLEYTVDNFMHNEISSTLILPVRLGNGIPFTDYLVMQEPFWEEVYSRPHILNLLVILINTGLIALGFAKTYQRHKWPLVAILTLHVVYSLSSAIVRLSGWRFIQPVDWMIYMLYAFGVVEAISWLLQRLFNWDLAGCSPWLMVETQPAPEKGLTWPKYVLSGLLFFSIGAFIPARENLLPMIAPQATVDQVCERINIALIENDYAYMSDDFMDFCQSDETLSLTGIGIYPRYFAVDEGYYDREEDPWFGLQDYAHLTFRSVGTTSRKVYIKTDEASIRFKNGAQVWFVGRIQDKFEAQFVLIEGEDPELLVSEQVIAGEDLLTPQLPESD